MAEQTSARRLPLSARAYRRYADLRREVGLRLRERLAIPTTGDHQAFARLSLPYEVLVYFADSPMNLYQIRQWLGALRELHRTHPVVILTRHSLTYRLLTEETDLPVVKSRFMEGVDDIYWNSDLKLCFYVNQNRANFQCMRYPDMFHVFLSHGESEKIYMASNQAKAYDYLFVAGDAAVERFDKSLIKFDRDKLVKIGRPALDLALREPRRNNSDRITVLYAPTWEGDRPSMSYGSVATHGKTIVRSLLADPRCRVILRLHPRTGIADPSVQLAADELRKMMKTAIAADPSAGHRLDDDLLFGPQMVESDVMICDISAVAIDYLPLGRPLIVTRPTSPTAIVPDDGVMTATYPLTVHERDVAGLVRRVVADDVKKAERQPFVAHFFGDVSPGAATARFLRACDELIARRDGEVSSKRSRLTTEERQRRTPIQDTAADLNAV
jgi:hypothetical protein